MNDTMNYNSYYGSGNSCLNIPVSIVKNYYSKQPRVANLLTWLTTSKYQERVEQIRNTQDADIRKRLKGQLAAITPSGLFTYLKEDCLHRHSGFIQFDIDLKDNLHIANYKHLHQQIGQIRNIAYCGKSVSGKGYWGLLRIGFPDKHEEHWEYLRRTFHRLGIHLDPAPKSTVSLRGASYDPTAYYNHQAVKLFHYINPPAPARSRDAQLPEQHSKKIQHLLQRIDATQKDITGSYKEWFVLGCNIAATYGNAGSSTFHSISQYYKGYNAQQAAYQYTQCLRYVKSQNSEASMGYFIKRCRELGVE